MKKLRSLLAKGLDRTRALWPDIRRSFRWVHAAARILKNTAGRAADDVKTRYTPGSRITAGSDSVVR